MHSGHHIRMTRIRPPSILFAALLPILIALAPAHGLAPARGAVLPDDAATGSHPTWQWPLPGPRDVLVPFRAPAHAYGPGHRGLDLTAGQDSTARAPADGVVAFRGTVADRPLLTVEHPGGYVSTFEPLASPLRPGDVVRTGDALGTIDLGGHAAAGTLHLGVRLDGAYIDPMLLFGGAPPRCPAASHRDPAPRRTAREAGTQARGCANR